MAAAERIRWASELMIAEQKENSTGSCVCVVSAMGSHPSSPLKVRWAGLGQCAQAGWLVPDRQSYAWPAAIISSRSAILLGIALLQHSLHAVSST